MSKQIYILRNEAIRRRAMESVWNAPDNYKLVISEETRSLEQNSRLWPSLTEISNQVMWHGRKLSPGDWKHVFTSSMKKMDVVPNLENTGFVALGLSTSKMSKRELSDLLELVYAFGAEHGVVFKDLEAA
jgi:hypothetical protein